MALTMRSIFSRRFVAEFGSRNLDRAPKQRLQVLHLEDRCVPALFTVNLLSDDGSTSGPTSGDLRFCLTQANASVGVPDTIQFDQAATAGQSILITAELSITDPVSITGPALVAGAPDVTIDGIGVAAGARHFNINETSGINTISISNLKLINGSTGGSGGSVLLTSVEDTFNFTDCVFDANKGANYGGAIGSAEPAVAVYGSLNLTRTRFTNNSNTGNFGGALGLAQLLSGAGITTGWTTNIVDTTFDSNSNARNGGALFLRGYAQKLNVTNTTFSNNTILDGFGGTISILSGAGAQSSTLTFTNCTFSANANNDPTFVNFLDGGSGGVFGNGGSATPTINLRYCTFTGNSATRTGGILAASSGNPTLNIESSILYGQTVGQGGSEFSGGTINAKNSIIFDKSGAAAFNDQGGNLFGVTGNPFLGALGTTLGGTSAYHVPGPGSPARENGFTVAGVTTDQRGGVRPLGAKVDIGSIESSDPTPIASATAANVLAPGGADYTFTVSYSDDVSINVASIGTGDITISGPNGFTATPTFIMVDNPVDGTPRLATYKFTAPVNGTAGFDFSDNGVYTVTMVASQVRDNTAPTPNFVLTGPLTTFTVGIPQTFKVNSLTDTGGPGGTGAGTTGDLRYVINKANLSVGAIDVITFDSVLFSTPQTIKLSGTEIAIDEALNIMGPGGGKVIISGEGLSRVFNLAGAGSYTVNVEGVTIAGGSATGDGGAFAISDESLNLTNVVLSGNSASGDGGGVVVSSSGGKFTATDSTFTGNVAGLGGGVAATNGNALLTFIRSTLEGNSASTGGAIDLKLGNVVVDSSLIAGNTAAGDGGGVHMTDAVGTILFRNSTISGNVAIGGAGLWTSHIGGLFQIRNTTITNNSSSGGGGGVLHIGGNAQPGDLVIVSSIIAGNFGTTADLDVSAVKATFTKSLIGGTSGAGIFVDDGTSPTVGSSAGLAPLAKNGGISRTHGILPGSAAIDAGSNPDSLPFDQRGTPFVRQLGSAVDIGAHEGILPIPGGSFAAIGPIINPGPTPNTVVVTYTDETGILVSSIDIGDIQILDPASSPLTITGISVVPGAGTSQIATYTFTPPVNGAAGWDATDNGQYKVNLLAGKVSDTDVPTPNLNVAQSLGIFNVSIILVTNANDSGAGSLRDAITIANTLAGSDTIIFDPTFFTGSMKTIQLLSILPVINDGGLTILGPGPSLATVSGEGAFTVIDTTIAAPGTKVTISGLTIANGSSAGSGGGISVNDENVTVTNSVITNNIAVGSGAGINVSAATGALTIINSTISNNSAASEGGGISSFANSLTISGSTISNNKASGGNGGGINLNTGGVNVTIASSTLSGNSSSGDGGGIYFLNGGSLNMTRSTVSGNTTAGGLGGAGIYFFGAINANGFRVSNSTFSGNIAAAAGGGAIFFSTLTGTAQILNSTIVNNSAVNGGGIGRDSGGGLTITSSIVANNSATGAAKDVNFGTALVNATFSAVGSDGAGSLNNYAGAGKNNVPLGTPLNLALALANNGGPTLTFLPGAGPLLNAGANTSPNSPNVDQIGNARTSGSQTDIGSVEIQSVSPVVTAFVVNGGATQRSRLTQVVVNFASPVDAAQFQAAGAVFFTRTGVASNNVEPNGTIVNNTNGLIIAPATGTVTSLTLTFANIDNAGIDFGSLSDGRWQLSVVPASFTSANGPTDIQLRRLFGDTDNSGNVDGTDFGTFPPFGATVANPFDFNNDSNIDGGDFGEFGGRFGYTLA